MKLLLVVFTLLTVSKDIACVDELKDVILSRTQDLLKN